jgi:hypothetical protein
MKECGCEEWYSGCLPYEKRIPECALDALEKLQVKICSMVPGDPRCSDKKLIESVYEIELYAVGKINVSEIIIVEKEVGDEEEFSCYGRNSDRTGGDLAYCEKNPICVNRATYFCNMNQKNLHLATKIDDCEIPIMGWGRKTIMYYPYKTISELRLERIIGDATCQNCKTECVRGAVDVYHQYADINSIRVCSGAFCSMERVLIDSQYDRFYLPVEIQITDHEVDTFYFKDSLLKNRTKIRCPAYPFCELINCYFCKQFLANPSCISRATGFVILLALILTLIVSYLVGSIVMTCCNIVMNAGRCCKIACYPVKKLFKVIWRCVCCFRSKGKTSLAIIFLMNIVVAESFGCTEVTTLRAEQSVCKVSESGRLTCTITETTRLALVPKGQDICLHMKTPNGDNLGTLILTVEEILLECQKKSEYFLRNFDIKTESVHRCPRMGHCDGSETCNTMKVTGRNPETSEDSNKAPGYSYCVPGGNGLAYGCGLVHVPGCIFYRNYLSPRDSEVYEVFSCPSWEYRVDVTGRKVTSDDTKTFASRLRPGRISREGSIHMTIIGITKPDTPILSDKFLTDGKNYAIIKASEQGSPIPNSVGSMQCANKESAMNFDQCFYSPDSCACAPKTEVVSCTCHTLDLREVLRNEQKSLPMKLKGFDIMALNNEVTVAFSDTVSIEVQITLEGLELATKYDDNMCYIEVSSFKGCYNCLTGAQITHICKTNFGHATAVVDCGGKQTFTSLCNSEGIGGTETMHFEESVISKRCVVSCPAGNSEFQLDGNLVYIDNRMLANYSAVYVDKIDKSGGMGVFSGWSGSLFGSFGAIFRTLAIGVVILIVVIVLIWFLKVYCLKSFSYSSVKTYSYDDKEALIDEIKRKNFGFSKQK